jgi:hypothetical protein
MANDPRYTAHERSGFPEELRAGSEASILADIEYKLPALHRRRGIQVIDIGCGANPLTDLIIARCKANNHRLILIDSAEVLAHHSESPDIALVAGRFPEVPELYAKETGKCDVVLAYSVLQYSFKDASVHSFVDAALTLLSPGGRLLVGDLPNASMRRRFLASDAGRAFHREYTGEDTDPQVAWPEIPLGELDDGVLLGLVTRCRDAGYHAWLMPQQSRLPMANRREDLLCERP